jgi:hypothetical protein
MHNTCRALTPEEKEIVIAHNVVAEGAVILVCDPFDPYRILHNFIFGTVTISSMEESWLHTQGSHFRVGIYASTVGNTTVGPNAAIERANYLVGVHIEEHVVIRNVDELYTFEPERNIQLQLGNENGGRMVEIFPGMVPGDVYLAYRYQGNLPFMQGIKRLNDEERKQVHSLTGTIRCGAVIKNSRTLRNLYVGPYTLIDGVDRIVEACIESSREAVTTIADGVTLVRGVVGEGNCITGGVRAESFGTGENVTLRNSVQLEHSYVAHNSNISGCELLHTFTFPFHEQHHRSSFLCAVTCYGQSNIAAGAVIGSNHNSRRNDGELVAGRGFWPGLCSSYKHPSRFASFSLVAKGDYQQELNIPLPFSLLSNSTDGSDLLVVVGYWFLYNMYALERNNRKYRLRDGRRNRQLPMETRYLAPDTVEEILSAMQLLEMLTGRAWTETDSYFGLEGGSSTVTSEREKTEYREIGKNLLIGKPEQAEQLCISAPEFIGVSGSARNVQVRLLKTVPAYHIYREMVNLYCIETIAGSGDSKGECSQAGSGFTELSYWCWQNLGGQLIPALTVENMIENICSGSITTWKELHQVYSREARKYEEYRRTHAWKALLELHSCSSEQVAPSRWREWVDKAIETAEKRRKLVYESREKDFTDPMRRITFDSTEEMKAVLGTIENDPVVREVNEATDALFTILKAARTQLDSPQ